MSDLLRISTDRAAIPVLHLDGSLDRRTTPLLRAEAAGVLAEGPLDLVIDCRGVEVVDAAGLRALLDIRRRLPPGGQLVVSDARPEVRRLLEITALDRTLFVLDDAILSTEGRVPPPVEPSPPTPSPGARQTTGGQS